MKYLRTSSISSSVQLGAVLERQLYVAYCHEPAANLGEFTTKAKLFRFHQANPQRTLADPTGAAP